uniref:Uncharacterized protein n=1 Tax=Corvus moneduloides TaxID=1196302 RepID=A0A8U7NCU3_CORMO
QQLRGAWAVLRAHGLSEEELKKNRLGGLFTTENVKPLFAEAARGALPARELQLCLQHRINNGWAAPKRPRPTSISQCQHPQRLSRASRELSLFTDVTSVSGLPPWKVWESLPSL